MKRFIISGGGTGGHIFPAVAIANELKKRFADAEILFVGARDRMEMQKVPQEGYAIEGLWISGIQRKLSVQNFLFPVKLLDSLLKARKIIKNFKPDVVIGTGGFASGAVLRVAQSLNIPTLIQEQNSYAGITNKLLAKNATKICVAYQNMELFFPKNKIVITGNPIRSELLALEHKKSAYFSKFGLDEKKKTLLVLGGSLGALRINELIEKELPFFEKLGIQVLWQCGKLYYEKYKKHENNSVKVCAFIDEMNLAYALADVVISRAGASSVSELCVVGKPVIFIPSPNVAEDHQTKNAKAVEMQKAAILLAENQLDSKFESVFSNLINDENLQAELSANIKKLAQPNATAQIVDVITQLIDNQ